MPTTPPVRKAMRIARGEPDSLAAAATRTLARTASHMPMYPVSAENAAPMRKKIDRPIRCEVVSAGNASSRKNATRANHASVRNCRAR